MSPLTLYPMNVLCFLSLRPFFMPLDILKMYNKMIQSYLKGQEEVEKHQLEAIINEMKIMAPVKSTKVILALNTCEWTSLLSDSSVVHYREQMDFADVCYLSLHPFRIGRCVTRWIWAHSCGCKKANETCLMLPCPLEMPECSKLQQRKIHCHLTLYIRSKKSNLRKILDTEPFNLMAFINIYSYSLEIYVIMKLKTYIRCLFIISAIRWTFPVDYKQVNMFVSIGS